MQNLGIIYGLIDPRTNSLRYIGKTSRSLAVRLKGHIDECCQSRNHRVNWIKSLLASGLRPTIKELCRCPLVELSETEIAFIASIRSVGAMLLNATDGGEGVMHGRTHSDQTKAKMSAFRSGRKRTPEFCAKISLALKGFKHSELAKVNMSIGQQCRFIAPEVRARLSAAQMGRKLSDAHRQNISAGNKGKIRTTATKERISKAHLGMTHSDESRKKMSASHRGLKQSPETVAKRIATIKFLKELNLLPRDFRAGVSS